jgi:hypothetical protein
MKKFIKKYEEIVTVSKLLSAWQGFLSGKKQRSDVAVFQSRLMDNILSLYNDLKNKTYQHGAYQAFNISDPKPRNIHKATIRDRLLHHLLYQETYDFFDRQLFMILIPVVLIKARIGRSAVLPIFPEKFRLMTVGRFGF